MTKQAAVVRIGLAVLVVSLFACRPYQVIPERFEPRVNRQVTFEQIQADPSSYVGHIVVWGGEVLQAGFADRTMVEVLQLPLTNELTPMENRPASGGRFLALDRGSNIVDPAIMRRGMPVTIVGEVTSPVTGWEGDDQRRYPTLVILDMTMWDVQTGIAWPGTGWGNYWGPYSFYGYLPYTIMIGTRAAG